MAEFDPAAEGWPHGGGISDVPGDDGGAGRSRRYSRRTYEVLFIRDLFALPDPEWQIVDILPGTRFLLLYAPSGTSKSFLALDWALSIALGLDWFGHPVKQGVVLYIAAEGFDGIKLRVRAWAKAKGMEESEALYSNFAVLGEAVQMLDGQCVDALLSAIARMPVKPSLIVIDTLARCMAGGDENSAQDMGIFVAACDRLRDETGATILVVHHSGKDQKSERGSSALRAAADCVMRIDTQSGVHTLRCEKQKDASEFEDETYRLVQVDLGVDERGRRLTSCRVEPCSGSAPRDSGNGGGNRQSRRDPTEITLEALRSRFAGGPVSGPDLLKATGLASSTFYDWLERLVADGDVVVTGRGNGRRYQSAEESVRFRVRPIPGIDGRSGTASGQADSDSGSSHPLKGVGERNRNRNRPGSGSGESTVPEPESTEGAEAEAQPEAAAPGRAKRKASRKPGRKSRPKTAPETSPQPPHPEEGISDA